MATVKINEITFPEHYVRGTVKSKHVQDLLDVVASHNGVGAWSDLIGKKTIQWPFPEIEIGKNLTPKPDKAKKGEKKGKNNKKWFPFELIDGGHRLTVAKRLKLKEIDAITRNIDNPGARFLHQYKTNVGHGLRLDKDARDNAIRTLAKVFNVSQKELVKETGLDVSSVSRIINSRQRKDGPRAPATPRALPIPSTGADIDSTESSSRGNVNINEGMTVEGFIDRLQGLTKEFKRLQAPLLAFLVANTPKSKLPKLAEFAGLVREISETFDDATKAESQPTAPASPTPIPTEQVTN